MDDHPMLRSPAVLANLSWTGKPAARRGDLSRALHRLLVMALCLLGPAVAGAVELPADAFSGATGWLNTATPVTTAMLKGQVVVVDFWTYCCINCMHVMPDLIAIEHRHQGDPLVVIGVHSGKFDQEKDIANIRAAILRNHLTHPVAVDSEFAIWKRFGVDSWPTLVVIGPTGEIVASYAGEGHAAQIERDIKDQLARGRAAHTLAKPIRFAPEIRTPHGLLSFPGKVHVDAATHRLLISDSGHDRILVCDLDGSVVQTVGSGHPGLVDGPAATAAFHEPQGITLSADGATAFVADRQNNALRAIDLKTGNVSTLAGDGIQGEDRSYDGPAARARLNSPWGLARHGQQIIIAMAGSHQLWSYTPKDASLRVLAGTGQEQCTDGTSTGASFAQPSGLAVDGDHLYVADSEDSSIRSVDLAPSVLVHTLAGSGDLFGFGAVDGSGGKARFQHPLGIAVVHLPAPTGDRLVVADTFNSRLRQIDPANGRVTTITIHGNAPDGKPISLFEPGGLAADGTTLYVADTNHDRIVVVTLPSGEARVLPVH